MHVPLMLEVIILAMCLLFVLFCTDFAILKAKYNAILSYLPERHEALIASLQDNLSDSQICDILSMTTGHSQKILNCLILQLKNKEDLLDFCDKLEKIQEAPDSLKDVVEQLRKGIMVYYIHSFVNYVSKALFNFVTLRKSGQNKIVATRQYT